MCVQVSFDISQIIGFIIILVENDSRIYSFQNIQANAYIFNQLKILSLTNIDYISFPAVSLNSSPNYLRAVNF